MADTYLDKLQSSARTIAANIAALQGELEEVRIAEKVHLRMSKALPPDESKTVILPVAKPGTVRSFVVEFLADHPPQWATSQEIHVGANKLKGSEIPTGTIYPTLSEMVRDKILIREGGKVALAERIKNNEAPSDSAPGPQGITHQGDQTGAV